MHSSEQNLLSIFDNISRFLSIKFALLANTKL